MMGPAACARPRPIRATETVNLVCFIAAKTLRGGRAMTRWAILWSLLLALSGCSEDKQPLAGTGQKELAIGYQGDPCTTDADCAGVVCRGGICCANPCCSACNADGVTCAAVAPSGTSCSQAASTKTLFSDDY